MFSASKTGAGASGYLISNSLRFQSASSTYLARTPASNGNRQVFTFSYWAKRGTLSVAQEMYFVNSGSGNFAQISWNSSNQIDITSADSSVAICQLITTPVYRDPSAWYHIVFSIDTTQATASNRVKIYVNGSQVTALSTATYPSLNYNFQLNNTTAQNIGRPTTGTFDGYLAEVNFIDGQALTPSSFGETDTTTGQWVAKKYTGTYGTNGFYLPFSNGTSTTTLGADSSGNGNNWTLNNFTRSAGVSDCWMTDVPSGNGGVSGTQPSSNYAVMSPLWKDASATVLDGNLRCYGSGATNRNVFSAMAIPPNEKIYFEANVVTGTSAGNYFSLGIAPSNFGLNTEAGSSGSFAVNSDQANASFKRISGVATSYGAGTNYATNNIVQIAIDQATGKIWFGKNNVWFDSGNPAAGTNPATSTLSTSAEYFPVVTFYQTSGLPVLAFNFGQRSFAYTPPTGFKALCTANLPAATIQKGNQYMDATLYTGNGSTQTITNAGGFSPDLVWLKGRSAATGNALYDTIRGALQYIGSESTAAELTVAGTVTSFNSNGFSIGNQAGTNANTATYVAWQWDAGSSTVTNTSGTISSQVRANPTAGVSIVTFTSTGAAATVGHGLGVAPSMIIVKARNNVSGWPVYHASIGNTGALRLDQTAATSTTIDWWRNTSPTSSVFSIGANFPNTFTEVAYCFSEISGFSKFGSYTGNGSADGTFVYTGFRPKFVMIKRTDAAASWYMIDTSRAPYNVVNPYLIANASNAEATDLSWDIVSNGFKLRSTYSEINASGANIIYMAFAENPFAQANAR